MAGTTGNKNSKPGVAKASPKIREEAARKAGAAYHEKRGQKGSDSTTIL